MTELERVIAFRNRLVTYMNLVGSTHTGFYSVGRDPADVARIQSEQPMLAQEYGRLYKIINRYGSMMMSSPALGVTSRDVIQDAIHDVNDVSYHDIARISQQHLDTVIGRLGADAEDEERARDAAATKKAAARRSTAEARERRSADDPDRLYRVTSPIYWLQSLARLLRWLFGTMRGRIVGAVVLIVGAIISGVVSGAATAVFERILASPSPIP